MTMAAARRTMFFASVAVLLSMMTSPKHPQSGTGSAMAMYTVRAVMAAMRRRVKRAVLFFFMAKRMHAPRVNSMVERMTLLAVRKVSGSEMCSMLLQ